MVSGDMDITTTEVASRSQLKCYGEYVEKLIADTEALVLAEPTTADFTLDPVLLQAVPFEKGNALELMQSGYQVLDKVLAALATLCIEIEKLVAEANDKFIPAILVYAECEEEGEKAEGEWLRSLSQMLPFFQELSVFIARTYDVIRNVIHQLASLYRSLKYVLNAYITLLRHIRCIRGEGIFNVKDVHFVPVFQSLGKLLASLVTLDESIAQHPCLHDHWSSFYKTILLVQHNPEKFEVEMSDFRPMERELIMKFELQIFSGLIFQNGVEQPLETGDISVVQNPALMEEFSYCLRSIISTIEKRIETGETVEQNCLVIATSLYACYQMVFKSQDKKAFRALWDLQKRIPGIHLTGNIVWSVEEFLCSKFPTLVDRKTQTQAKMNRSADFSQKVQSLPRYADSAIRQTSEWSLNMKTVLKSWSAEINSDLDKRYRLFLQGLHLASETGEMLRYVLSSHLKEKKAMSKSTALCIFRLMELLKEIEGVFRGNWIPILESVGHISQRWGAVFLKSVAEIAFALRNTKKPSVKNMERLAAFTIAEKTLTGPASRERLLVLNLALSGGSYQKLLKAEEAAVATLHLEKFLLISDFLAQLRRACDCNIVFWHKSLLPAYFGGLLQEVGKDPHRLPYFFATLSDCVAVVTKAKHVPGDTAVKLFEQEISMAFEEHFLKKLCQLIETDLRLSIHGHLQLDERNPLKSGHEEKELDSFIALPPLRLRSRAIDIKRYVERYLDKTFYDLTTVALHDWKTYAEMRQLARQKYSLTLAETHLPSQTLEQGLDVLEIMRNIHIFVSNYLYNLNTQVFIERSNNSRHLNSLSSKHIANSIRTHGTGIMSTTVNFTYQFLRKKFYVFSQFLYDDQIKSRLLKDARYFRENKEKLGGKYPMEKAEKFNRGIRKLGLSPDGLSYLDRFRILITQIGNALGYVRLVRAGGLQACSEAAQFIPDLEDVVPLAPLCEQAGLSPETLQAASGFDSLVSSLVGNLAEGTEYFKLLVDVFVPEFRTNKQVHLKTFYAIVPPLTVNYVEHMVGCKERLGKKGHSIPGSFTDDGFAMGVAYILKLLDQYEEFDSLQWFQSADTKFAKEREEITKQTQKSTGAQGGAQDEKLTQTLTLSLRRSQLYRREFEMLSFALRSARIFFRTDVERELIPKEREEHSETSSIKSQAPSNMC